MPRSCALGDSGAAAARSAVSSSSMLTGCGAPGAHALSNLLKAEKAPRQTSADGGACGAACDAAAAAAATELQTFAFRAYM